MTYVHQLDANIDRLMPHPDNLESIETVMSLAIQKGNEEWVRFLVRDLKADVDLVIEQRDGTNKTYLTSVMVCEVG
jgi:hypothetical protein